MKKRKSAGFDLKPILIGISIILIPGIIYILYYISNSTNRLIPISVIALITGAIIENKRLTPKWSTVFNIAILSFVLSFLCFLPGRNEYQYIFENHIATWPYMFLVIFVIMSYAFNKDKIIPRMTESITLIMSVGLIYWLIDHGFYNSNSLFLKAIIILGFVIAIFSIINAFINIKLTKSLRLILSIWSSIIMILLAVDNILLVYQNGEIEDSVFLIDKISVGLQYFLLGICSVYILQNTMMIMRFLPDKGRFFNNEYFRDVRELKNEHIDRYSENQSKIILSLICLILSSGFLFVNYHFDLLPRNTAIWIVFFVLNTIVYFYENFNDNYIPKHQQKSK
jgi:hypothetical protein